VKATDAAVDALLAKVAAARPTKAGAPATLQIEGTYEVAIPDLPDPVKGPFREIYAGKDLARQTSDMGPFGAMEKGLQRDLVWEVDPSMGAKIRHGTDASAMRRFFALMRGDDPRSTYRSIERTGTKAIDGRDCTALRMTPAEGKPDVWYVDAEGRVVRVETALPAPESAAAAFGMDDLMPAEISFADWRTVDGALLPHKRVMTMGPASVTSTCTKVTLGGAIDVAKFAPPEAVNKLDKTPVVPAFGSDGKPNYQVLERQAQPVASIRCKIKPTEIATQLAIMLPEVMAHINAVGGRMAGAPFSRYHSFTDEEIDIEAGIPVLAPFTAKGRVQNSELPACKAVMCWHVGPYEKLTEAHAGLSAYLDQNKLKARGGPWEIYWTDPGMVPDPAKWKTQLFAPIE
jgi:effector-binding domain-containing protein